MDLAVEARDAAGTLLGFAVINGSGTENPYVSNVAVDPAAQGAGVAAKLLQHAGRVRFRNLLPRFRKDANGGFSCTVAHVGPKKGFRILARTPVASNSYEK